MDPKFLTVAYWVVIGLGMACLVWALILVGNNRAAAMVPFGLAVSALIIGYSLYSWGEARERGTAIMVTGIVALVLVQALIFGLSYLMRR